MEKKSKSNHIAACKVKTRPKTGSSNFSKGLRALKCGLDSKDEAWKRKKNFFGLVAKNTKKNWEEKKKVMKTTKKKEKKEGKRKEWENKKRKGLPDLFFSMEYHSMARKGKTSGNCKTRSFYDQLRRKKFNFSVSWIPEFFFFFLISVCMPRKVLNGEKRVAAAVKRLFSLIKMRKGGRGEGTEGKWKAVGDCLNSAKKKKN